ncbi:NAD(P)/FAD-dependent oxidoreductase [Phenylobacterium aquaticum]|uniref:NAD(P)/FAD-dependent oxidoreductase n=1 Tax=Phenylobacterium aquaticum TaxID=1763816 RepID=UPI001F5D3470|nr:FAD-dependent oxidoreductase [Phenylobacterium aquaticum]MCI3132231.1 FAD-dependent oxidoreductase [Phenylobacterium aquaticum]
MNNRTGPVVVVGAGQAAAALARALREMGFTGRIRILGEEPQPPYERPPLSKQVLMDGRLPDSIWLMGEDIRRTQAVDLTTSTRVVEIHRTARQVMTDTGEAVPYETLVLATGGLARRLPDLPVDGRRVFEVRTLDDSLSLHARLADARRVLVIGGGWLGLEIAATARERGCDVTLVEAAPRLCVRSVPPEVSEYLRQLHRAQGVDVRLGECAAPTVTETAVSLGAEAYDLAVVAIGLAARDELAAAAGLPTADGVLTDCSGATEDPDIFAIGDVARLCSSAGQPGVRLESWRHAETQGRLAAGAILGRPMGYDEPAWFWSDQFDHLIQIAGLPRPDLELIDESPGEKPLWRYGRDGQVETVIGVDRARDVRMAQRGLPSLASRIGDLRP